MRSPPTTRSSRSSSSFNGVGSEFTYDQTVEPRNDSSALLDFLQNTKKGFCQQFAASMAVMLRSIGIPARVAVGFTAGTFDDATDNLRVTTENAHAWVEVLFPGYGWLTFEPTPGRENGAVAAYPYTDPTSDACQPRPGNDCGTDTTTGGKKGPREVVPPFGPTGTIKDNARPGGLEPAAARGRGGVDPDITVPEPARRITVRQAALLALLLGLIVLAMIPVVRAWRRRRRLRRASDEPRGLILATYDVFTERAGELGFPREPGQTVEEYRARILASQPLSGGDLDRLTRLTADAAYAPRDPQPDEAREATQAADSALKELKKRHRVRPARGRPVPADLTPPGAVGARYRWRCAPPLREGPARTSRGPLRTDGRWSRRRSRCRRSPRRTPSVLRGARPSPHRRAGRS